MLCPTCNNFRPANNAACPLCHAPSPLVNDGQGSGPLAGNVWGNQSSFGSSGFWGNAASSAGEGRSPSGQLPFSSSSWQDVSEMEAQQLPFPAANQSTFAQQPALNKQPFWTQEEASGTQSPGQSLLPVPYQGPPGPQSQALALMKGFPVPGSGEQALNPRLPALPDNGQELPVYVAPMYTKPRPIIPRYRAISGLLSVLIVFVGLCAGAGYYAKVTGKFAFLQKLMGSYMPPAINSTQHQLPIPSILQTPGVADAANSIPSVAISDKIDQNGQIANYVNHFTVGQMIYLTCRITSAQPGAITLKWYTNNNLYRSLPPLMVDPQKQNTALFKMRYALATEGKVEIYWNNQLAKTLLFVVEP